MSSLQDAIDADQALQGTMWCHRCNGRTPVHMIWYKASPTRSQTFTIAQAVCDECLDAAVVSLSSARALRARLGEKVTYIRVALL